MPLKNLEANNFRTLDSHIQAMNLESQRPRINANIQATIEKLRLDKTNHVALLILRDMSGAFRDAMACDARDLQDISDRAYYFRHSYKDPIELDFTHVNEVRQNLGLEYCGPEDRMTPIETWGSQG